MVNITQLRLYLDEDSGKVPIPRGSNYILMLFDGIKLARSILENNFFALGSSTQ